MVNLSSENKENPITTSASYVWTCFLVRVLNTDPVPKVKITMRKRGISFKLRALVEMSKSCTFVRGKIVEVSVHGDFV